MHDESYSWHITHLIVDSCEVVKQVPCWHLKRIINCNHSKTESFLNVSIYSGSRQVELFLFSCKILNKN